MSARTGLPEAVLRSWEARFGFPAPVRPEGGHRRYSELDVERLLAVVREREAGMSLAGAIDRARSLGRETERTLFATLRRSRPELQPQRAGVPTMLALSRAIEDEVLARAEPAVMFGCFQRKRHYDPARERWRELARVAEGSYVLADFKRRSARAGRPVEVPIGRDDPVAREWSVVADGPRFGAVLAGWERPTERERRVFECVWSIEPEVVREASHRVAELAREAGADIELPARIDEPAPPADPAVRDLSLLAHRMIGYLASG